MSYLEGGAETHARSKQYEYHANSSLVLAEDLDRQGNHEPTGEPQSLQGKIYLKHFGDRARHESSILDEKLQTFKKKKEREPMEPVPDQTLHRKRRRFQEESVLFLADDGGYWPKTMVTCAAYETLLNMVQQQIGGQPQDILHGAASKVLSILKNEKCENTDMKNEIENFLNPISNQFFDQLVSIGRLIKDFQAEGEIMVSANANTEALDDEIGVAVEFKEDEEEEESIYDQIHEELDDDEDGDQEFNGIWSIQMDGTNEDDLDEAIEELTLNVQDIDAYWLQRKISQAYKEIDPKDSHKLAEDVLKILAEGNDIDVENRLVMLMNYDKFVLIKLLLRNRLKITWCTRLARAEDPGQRKRIEEEMRMAGASLVAILEELQVTRVSAKEHQKYLGKSIQEEARRLNNEGGGKDGKRVSDQIIFSREVKNEQLKGPHQLLDLDSIAFHHGDLLMSNIRCDLPQGCYRTLHKGYDEVYVPAPKPKEFTPEEQPIKISNMPDWAQKAFEGLEHLNRVQSKVYKAALFTSENILLCAPTGAGKTNVAVLTILHQIGLHRKDGVLDNTKYKIVYVAPMKALVAEVVRNLSNRLESYGIVVRELSGDNSLTGLQFEESQIIVTTPEKWDIVTRKSGDRVYTNLVKLIIIDEIHLLHDNRGPVLESIITRTFRQIENSKELVRFVGLSATLPNYKDVAQFLRVNPYEGLFHFDNSYRPCPLAQRYIGITAKQPLQRFQLINEICYEKVVAAAGKHQVLIFVHSRKETTKTARAIRDVALANNKLSRFLKDDCASREILQSLTGSVQSNDLKDLLPYGFAIHHAGMSRLDRDLVEEYFTNKHIQVLVSTATLAWGVNLPAHTVIIKGTQVYNPERGAWTELNSLDVMQMIGRAGRPQHDSYGEGIILTGHNELMYYLSLMNQQLPIESQFVSKLADNLNAEIVLGTVQDVREACIWIGYTYLYIRMRRNPSLYGLPADILDRDETLDGRRADLIHSAATVLEKNNLIKYDKKTGCFQSTDLGRIASYYYVSHGTISTYNKYLKPTMGDIQLFELFSLSEEFKYVSVRQDEKVELAKLLERVPVPVKESLNEPSAKINVLLQTYISNLKLEGLSLASDMVFIRQSAGRLLRALFEIVLRRGWAQLAKKLLNLCKSVDKQMWGIQTPLHQFHDIPNAILGKLEKKVLAWERYCDLSPQEIGELIRYPKMGRLLYKRIHQVPKVNLTAHVQPISHTTLSIELKIIPDFQWNDKVHECAEPFWIIVEDNDGECILHYEYFILKKQFIEDDHTLNFIVSIYEPLPPQYFIWVVSDRWLGSQTVLPVCFRHLILPEKYPPATELLDLQPLPMTALRNPEYEALYATFKQFNPIQTQVFTALYNTDYNVLVAAPTGSGKTICAEFALLRNHQKEPSGSMRAIYIAPIDALAAERYREWKEKFEKNLGIHVVKLTGNIMRDMKLLEEGKIIISTPEKWDVLSRRWKQCKPIQKISLFIVDELHLIGGPMGPILEIIISRVRRITSQIGSNTRIVALSVSLANAKDIGEWIGVTSHGLFNFPPEARPVPLDIHIQSIDILNFEARMRAMTKPTYTAIIQNAKNGESALVFVPTRQYVMLTALDFCNYFHTEMGKKPLFLLGSDAEVEAVLPGIKEETLKRTLPLGVGYLHEGLDEHDQKIVLQLFVDGKIQVCVASSSMCRGQPIPAHLVVVMGTQYYDGHNNAHTDYRITNLLQMMGHANRPLINSSNKCVILCHTSQKSYYKKFLYEAIVVESHLHHFLHDHLNAEVVACVLRSKQDAVDFFTWTFMYRRLTKNPNYYNLHGISHRHLSDYLSELVENTLTDLEASKCVCISEDMYVKASKLGLIASYHYISYTTIERFNSSLTQKAKKMDLLDILASSSEYAELPIRPGEQELLKTLINHQRFSFKNPKYTDPHVKAKALLQARISRQKLVGNLALDQQQVLWSAYRLIHGMVDVISSNGWLSLALSAMELSQMLTQGMWITDSVALQLPHFTNELVKRCEVNLGRSMATVFDLLDIEENDRTALLQMPGPQLLEIAEFISRLNIDMSYEVINGDIVRPGENVTLQVMLECDLEMLVEMGPANAKDGWWLVVGDTGISELLAIKRVSLQNTCKVKLDFPAPSEVGKKAYTVYFMSDSYVGCDQEYVFTLDVRDNREDDGVIDAKRADIEIWSGLLLC